MAPKFNIRPQDIPLLTRALQSLASAPVSWFGPVDDPALVPDMQNAARALPLKLNLHAIQLSDLELLALQQACAYQCLTASPSRQEAALLESYSDQFLALLSVGNPGMLP